MVTGESEINAASSVTALVFSGYFDLEKTYFMIAGIAGVNPEVATLASVTFAKYAVQVALQYEFDAREIPDNFTSGYVPLGAHSPDQYPVNIYGTEVFEVNEALRDMAISLASTAILNDSTTSQAYRALYAPVSAYATAAAPPSIVACDVATSDVYYSGALLSQAFENTTKLYTNGSGLYCSSAQEDNACLEALLRSTAANLTDFSRIIVMRTCSDFDRPPPGVNDIDNMFYVNQGGFSPAVQNIYLAGVKVIEGIVDGWEDTFEKGVNATNYVGDIFETLGGTADFGAPADFITKRNGLGRRERRAVRPKGL
jgi:purine nucleoside permease